MSNENVEASNESPNRIYIKILHGLFIIIIFFAGGFGFYNLHDMNDCNKLLTYCGLVLSIVGTYCAGPIANGIPLKGDIIKAPKILWAVIGWLLVMGGFLISAIGTLQLF